MPLLDSDNGVVEPLVEDQRELLAFGTQIKLN
jgi:hypothetical protein